MSAPLDDANSCREALGRELSGGRMGYDLTEWTLMRSGPWQSSYRFPLRSESGVLRPEGVALTGFRKTEVE